MSGQTCLRWVWLSSVAAQALVETGEAMKQIADIKYSLDDSMKQSFLEPLHHLQSKDLKEVMVSYRAWGDKCS